MVQGRGTEAPPQEGITGAVVFKLLLWRMDAGGQLGKLAAHEGGRGQWP